MNIRWKVAALIAALFVVLGIAEILVARNVLMPSFVELEQADAGVAMRRVRYALDRSLDQLMGSTTGWANWADTYRFAREHNRSFIDDNITVIGLRQLDVNVLAILDRDGRMIASAALDLESGKPMDLDLLRQTTLAADFPWRSNLPEGRAARGLLQTNRGILMLTASPILDGFGHGPTRGLVIMGRLLSAAEVSRLGDQAQVRLSMGPPLPSNQRDRLVQSDASTAVYHTLDDIYGHPIRAIQVNVPREVTRRGRSAVLYATGCLAGAAVAAVILLVIALNGMVLAPLARVTSHAVAIGENADLTTRLGFNRKDEIGVLAREIDRMVARIAESRSQLVDRSFHAGFAELAKGVLHNLGNAMTPIGVRLASLRGRLRGIELGDFDLVASELSQDDLSTERRKDIGEFLRLANGSLGTALRSVEEDADVISRQTSIVQAALSEQLRSARNEHVTEPVLLPELLSQVLDVVPDAARERLKIEADPSLQQVGVITVPRTILGLVLQNIIINSADSVRQAGKARGSLRLIASVDRTADGETLLLSCSDDGVGMAADQLARIFEKGYTTKSRETNFGIGLHWCANSLIALGGRIWASSDGPGQGAALHVQLPLKTRDSLATGKAA